MDETGALFSGVTFTVISSDNLSEKDHILVGVSYITLYLSQY